MATLPPPEITDETITNILAQLYDQRPTSVWRLSGGSNHSGGGNMHVYAASFPGNLEDRVIKLAGAEVWKQWTILEEQAVMGALRREGLTEVPTVEYSQNDLGWTTVPFLTMPHVQPGVNLATAIGPDHEEAADLWRKAGNLRARFSQIDWQCSRHTSPPRQVAEQLLRFVDSAEEAVAARPSYARVFTDLFAAIREFARSPLTYLGQTDPCEVLTCGQNGLALVDFSGFVGAHRRLRELGMINGWLRWKYDGDAPHSLVAGRGLL